MFDGNRIIGACLTDSFVSGYPALKALMSIQRGSYILVSIKPSDGVDVNHSFDIEADALIGQISGLPELASPPVNQESPIQKILRSRAEFAAQSITWPPPSEEWTDVAESESTRRASCIAERPDGGLYLNSHLVLWDRLAGLGSLISKTFKALRSALKRRPLPRRVGSLSSGRSSPRPESQVAVVAISLVLILGWKALAPVIGLTWPQAKNSAPSLPARSHFGPRATDSGTRWKKLEASARARQRSAIPKRRL
jgi:hypothetical protein